MSKIPEITNEQIVARLRMIVAEPSSLCKTDLHFIEDAADEIERLEAEVARLWQLVEEYRQANTERAFEISRSIR
jgi:HAMP domain-containing protein